MEVHLLELFDIVGSFSIFDSFLKVHNRGVRADGDFIPSSIGTIDEHRMSFSSLRIERALIWFYFTFRISVQLCEDTTDMLDGIFNTESTDHGSKGKYT